MSPNRLHSTTLWLLLLCSTASCGSNSTTHIEEEDIAPEPMTLTGRIAIPFAVTGANVELMVMAEADEEMAGLTLSSAVSDEEGLFQVEVPASVDTGTVMRIVATGLSAKVALLDTNLALGADCTLEAVFVWDGGQKTNLVVDLYSTLASALVDGMQRNKAIARSEVSAWQQRVHQANDAFGKHLEQPSGIGIPWVEPTNMASTTFTWPSPTSTLALANLALWRMGSGSEAQPQVTGLLGLLNLLRKDLSDGLFDGMGYASADASKPGALDGIDAQTTRHELAKALHAALTQPGFPLDNVPELEIVQFGERDGLYAVWSLDDGSLYPEQTPGVLFDPFLPEVWFSVAPEAEGTEVCKGFTVEVQAKDNDRIASLVLESPSWDGISVDVETDDEAGTAKATVQLDPLTALSLEQTSMVIRFRAVDPSANEAAVERTLALHQTAPTLTQTSPTGDNCLGVWPETFKVRSTDEQGLAKVEVVTDDALYPCTALADDQWECEMVGEAPLVRATDTCGITSELTISFCVDGEEPVITYELATAFCGPLYNKAAVTVTDNMGVAKVEITSNGITSEIEDFDGPFDVYFDLEGPDPAVVTVKAWDIWDRTASVDIECPLDVTAPLVWPEEGGIVLRGEAPSLDFEINVVDALSEVTEVKAFGDGGTWAVSQQDDLWLISGVKDGGFVNGDLITIEVKAIDFYGNESLPITLWVVVDGASPEVEMGSTSFFDEAGAATVLDVGTQTVSYLLDGAPAVALNPVSCDPVCPAFTKLPSRLSEQEGTVPSDENLPVFRFLLSDPCIPQVAGSEQISVKAHFYRDEMLLNTADLGTVACGGASIEVPVSIERFSTVAQEEFEFVEANIPNRLVVEAVDLVGNTQTTEVNFLMSIAALAPFISADVPEEFDSEWVGGCIEPEAPLLHEVAEDGRILTRHRVYNPYPIPLRIKVTAAPQEKVVIQKATIYADPQEKLGFQCVISSLCRYWTVEHPEGQCIDIVEFPVEDLFRRLNLPTVAFWETPGTSEAMGDQYMVLPPFSEAWMSFRNEYASEGFTLSAPVPVSVEVGVAKPGYLVEEYVSAAECRSLDNTVSISYDLPTILSMYASTASAGTKLYWASALLGDEVVGEKTTNVGWNYLYWPAFAMHQLPYK